MVKHPKGIGTSWRTKHFIHGGRVMSPKLFKKIYIVPQVWARRRGLKIPRGIPRASRVKVGSLKRSGRFAVQSYITPVSSHWRKGVPVNGYVRRRKRGLNG